MKLVKAEIKRLEKEEQKERAAAEKSELDLREAEGKYNAKLQELNEIEATLETERSEVLKHTAAFERLTEIARQLEHTNERLQERAEGLTREGKRATEAYDEYRKDAEKLEKTLEKERGKLENLQAEKREILEESKQARADLESSEKILKDLRDEFSRKRNRLETLQNSKKNAPSTRRPCRRFSPNRNESA